MYIKNFLNFLRVHGEKGSIKNCYFFINGWTDSDYAEK